MKGSESTGLLGIILGKELDMKKFIAAKARAAYFNIQKIKKIRKYLTEDNTKMLICSMVLSHLDYGNAILVNLPKSTLKPLQSIQNYAAKVTCKNRNITALLIAYQGFTGYQNTTDVFINLWPLCTKH